MTIWDRIHRRPFLIDSGADECVYPATNQDLSRPRSAPLVAANGTAIDTFGKKTLQLSFAPGHTISQSFWIAQVRRPILGANFFIDHRILIDLPNRRLLDNAARPFLGRPAGWPTVSGLHRPSGGPFEALSLIHI